VLREKFLEIGGEYGVDSMAKAHLSKITQLAELEQRIAELDATISQLTTVGAVADGDTGDMEIKRATLLDRAMADMAYDRAVRAAKLETLKLRYRPGHRKIIETLAELKVIDDAIEARRQQIATLGKTGALTTANEKDASESVEELKILLQKLGARREEMRRETRTLNGKLIELKFIEGERAEVRDMLDETRRALEEVRVESRTELPGMIEIISRARAPELPISDKRPKFALIGVLFGLLAGLGGVVSMSLFDRRCRFSDELGEIHPRADVAGVLPNCDADSDRFARSVHGLRNLLQLTSKQGDSGALIMVTGASAGAGSSRIGLELGKSFSEQRFATIVVDADLAQSDLTDRLELSDKPGLREALLGSASVREMSIEGSEKFSALPAGLQAEVGDSSVSLKDFDRVFEELRNQFEVVIVDAGPITERLGAALLAALADRVLLVSRAGGSSRDVRRALDVLERSASGRVHVAFNDANPRDPGLFARNQAQRPRRVAA
jgi:Mrp family chromosome partitioning ATPase